MRRVAPLTGTNSGCRVPAPLARRVRSIPMMDILMAALALALFAAAIGYTYACERL
jgi:hypothetical protein